MKKVEFELYDGSTRTFTGHDLSVDVHDKFTWVRDQPSDKFVAAIKNEYIVGFKEVK